MVEVVVALPNDHWIIIVVIDANILDVLGNELEGQISEECVRTKGKGYELVVRALLKVHKIRVKQVLLILEEVTDFPMMCFLESF